MMNKKKAKKLDKKLRSLQKLAESKRLRGEDFSHDFAVIQGLLARFLTDDYNPARLNWHTDFLDKPELGFVLERLGMGGAGRLVERLPMTGQTAGDIALGFANWFSHLKVIEETIEPNWIKLTPGLLFGLLLTDLKGTKGSDINMPLKSFIIELPRNAIFTHDSQTGMHETRYIIVTETERPELGRHLFMFAWSQPNENSISIDDDHAEYFPLDISDDRESLQTFIDVYEDVFKEEMRALRRKGVFKRDVRGTIFGDSFSGAAFRERLLRIVINTILYINSYNPSVESIHQARIEEIKEEAAERGRKLSRAEKKEIDNLEDDPHYVIGTDIQITKGDIADFKKSNKRWTLSKPSITRGHWKMQPYGPKRSLRKLIWIKPYIRGKELGGEVEPHRYHVENPSVPFWWPEDDDFDDEYEYA